MIIIADLNLDPFIGFAHRSREQTYLVWSHHRDVRHLRGSKIVVSGALVVKTPGAQMQAAQRRSTSQISSSRASPALPLFIQHSLHLRWHGEEQCDSLTSNQCKFMCGDRAAESPITEPRRAKPGTIRDPSVIQCDIQEEPTCRLPLSYPSISLSDFNELLKCYDEYFGVAGRTCGLDHQ